MTAQQLSDLGDCLAGVVNGLEMCRGSDDVARIRFNIGYSREHAKDAQKILEKLTPTDSPKHKFVRINTRPFGPNVLVVDIYQGDEHMKPLGTFRMASVTKIESRAGTKSHVFIEAGETVDDVERRALAMLEAVRIARELEASDAKE